MGQHHDPQNDNQLTQVPFAWGTRSTALLIANINRVCLLYLNSIVKTPLPCRQPTHHPIIIVKLASPRMDGEELVGLIATSVMDYEILSHGAVGQPYEEAP